MSIARLILVLVSALSVMLTLVVLRTETVRFRYAIANTERDCELLEQDIREGQLDLARLGNPSALRERLIDLKGLGLATPAKPESAPEKPKAAGSSKPRKP